MKKLLLSTFLILNLMLCFSQTPEKFNYQAVVRNADGTIVTNQPVSLRFTIDSAPSGGSPLYIEVHATTTNSYGLVNIQIGNGTVISGSMSTINWSTGSYTVLTEVDPNGGTSFSVSGLSQLVSVPYALHAKTVDNTDDADADPTNELQTLEQAGTNVTLSNGGGTISINDADSSPTNELQTISKVGNIITLSNGGGAVMDDINDADADPTNELQTISLVGSNIVLSNGGGAVSINDADSNPTNELQTLSQVGTNVTLSNGGGTISVNDGDSSPTNELQTLSQVGSNVTLSNGGGTISVNDADSSPTNELQNLSIVGDQLTISSGNTVTLPSGGGSDQTLSVSGTDLTISGAGGNTVTLNVNDADADPTNELQNLSIIGDQLTISSGNTITIPTGGGVDQTLSISGSDLTISGAGGNTITLPSGGGGDPDQTLSISGNEITISGTGGNTITLPERFYVGQHHGGGIIVFVDSTGEHGLIASPVDVVVGAGVLWQNNLAGNVAGAESLTDGQANTAAIVAFFPALNGTNCAAHAANNYAGGGFSDWYLPSFTEMLLVYQNAYVIGNLHMFGTGNAYWTSTQAPGSFGTQAGEVLMNGTSQGQSKGNLRRVRAVRQF